MKALKQAVVHGAVLAVMDILAVLLGFVVYVMVRPAPQLMVQVPVAGAAVVVLFVLWVLAIENREPGSSEPRRWEWVLIGLGSLVMAPIFFVPLHYIGRGHLTGWGNLISLWIFQVPVNIVALLVAARVSGRR